MRFVMLAAAAAMMLAAPLGAQGNEAPIPTKSGTIGPAPAEQGQIIFYRTGSMFGAALGCTVHEGEGAADVELARLGSGKYYVVNAAPGKHQYYTKGEAKDRLNMEIEAGETYFVRCNIGMGVMSGRANLSPSDRAAFASKAKGLALWKGGN